MKLSKEESTLLFSTPATAEASAQAPVAPTTTTGLSPAAPPSKGAPSLLLLLRQVAPSLWRKIDPRQSNRKERRLEFLRLITWLADKHGLRLEEGAAQVYQNKLGKVEGRLHGVLRSTTESVALELAYELNDATLRKLYHAHLDRHIAVLLWAGPPAPLAELLARITALCEGYKPYWLNVVLLQGH